MSDPRVTVELLARADASSKGFLSQARSKQWQEVLNDTGLGKITLQNDDADLALVEYGDYLRFYLDGVACFASIIEQVDRVDVAPGEDADEATVFSGRGVLALLEDAVVRPDFSYDNIPFADARTFNFAAFNGLTAEQSPINLAPYDFGDRPTAGVYAGMPADFPSVFSHWIGGAAPDGSGNNPVGDWYFESWFTITPGTEGVYRLYLGYDDAIDLWIDNVPLLQNDGATANATKTLDVYLAATFHYISARITNHTGVTPNPSGLTAALCLIDENGDAGAEAWATDGTSVNQKVSGYVATPPAFTPGNVADELFFNAETLDDVSVFINVLTQNWTTALDSAGVAWADRINPSFQIGMDLLTAFKQLAESYFDMWVDPVTFELNLYQSKGSASAAAYEAGENVTDLKHTGQF